MEDLGAETSYLTLEPGTAVYASDGERIGRVGRVLADEGSDIFDGIVLEHGLVPPTRHYVVADRIERIHERGVVLDIDSAAAEALPAPSGNQ